MLGSNNVCACLAVKDMAAASKYYSETLGLKADKETPGGTFFKAGNSGVFVYPSQYAGTNQATSAAWMVSDVEGPGGTIRFITPTPLLQARADSALSNGKLLGSESVRSSMRSTLNVS